MPASDENFLLSTIGEIKKKIPDQGPLEYFVHHNTLQSYEDKNFFDAVKEAALDFNAKAFSPEDFYQYKYNTRVLKRSALVAVVADFVSRKKLDVPLEVVLRLLLDHVDSAAGKHEPEIMAAREKYVVEKPFFHTRIMERDFGLNIDFYTDSTVYRFLSAYFDYGSALWLLDDRQEGMWKRFCQLHHSRNFFENAYKRNLIRLVRRCEKMSAIETIEYVIEALSVPEKYTREFLFETCVKHQGWAGFIKALEKHPDWIKNEEIKPSFVEFIAISLICDYAAILAFAKKPIEVPRFEKTPLHSVGFLRRFYDGMDKYPDIKNQLLAALPHLTDFDRQEIFHRAYEDSFYNMFLTAYASRENHSPAGGEHLYQTVFCIDDREESFRRYLEMDEGCETFSSAGHFGLNILYKSYFSKTYRSLCPVNVKADYKIVEVATHVNRLKLGFLHLCGEIQWLWEKGSRSLLIGSLQTVLFGVFRSFPLILDVIDPRIMLKLKASISKFLKSSVSTKVMYKSEEDPTLGLTLEARASLAGDFLKTIGLNKNISPFVFLIGHGSSSLNNPFEATYDCGACGGGRGTVNGRLMASILNEKKVRDHLARLQIIIPPTTTFVGAYHNTCTDEVEFFDADELMNQPEFVKCVKHIRKAAALGAVERSRRFQDPPKKKDPNLYLDFVRSRSVDLRQPRPEYGHATNALCIIGPRSCTREMFLDRRAFLVSYDPSGDPEAATLKKILDAVIPVCSGINLEYYFSFVDNEVYGCGTKLPHNVNGLVGVINGHMSDLRLGLSWQVVEIHQPIRLFVTIASPLETVKDLLKGRSSFSKLAKNEWINLGVQEPSTGKLWVYKNGDFKEFKSERTPQKYLLSDDRILNVRTHLDFGVIAHGL